MWIIKFDLRQNKKFELTNNNCIINQTSLPSKEMSFKTETDSQTQGTSW